MPEYRYVRLKRIRNGVDMFVGMETSRSQFKYEVKSAAKPKKTKPKKKDDSAEKSDDASAAPSKFNLAHIGFGEAMMSFTLASARVMSITQLAPAIEMTTELFPHLIKSGEVIHSDDRYLEFKIDERKYHTVSDFIVRHISIIRFLNLIPDHLLGSVLSQYDVFIAKLIEASFDVQQQLAKTIERKFSYADLLEFGSIDEVRRAVVEREVESILYRSHIEHLDWFKARGVNVREHFDRLPEFVEICERRNAIVHNEGRAGSRYLARCAEFNVDTSSVKEGDKLSVNPKYYARAVTVILELGFRLGTLVWQKLAKDEREQAASFAQNFVYELICMRQYASAIRLIEFALEHLEWPQEMTKLMAIVNLANAYRLNDQADKAKAVLDEVHWDTKSDMFKISVASVRGSCVDCAELIKRIGPNGEVSASDYRTWPVFMKTRDEAAFQNAFEQVFGESLWGEIGKVEGGVPEDEPIH